MKEKQEEDMHKQETNYQNALLLDLTIESPEVVIFVEERLEVET
jgi:hypothetical protein